MNDGAIMGINKTPVFNMEEIESSTSNTGGLQLRTYEAAGTATAAATFSIAVNVPSAAIIIAHQLRVDTALSDNWDAAYAGGSTASITSNSNKAKNTKISASFVYGTTPVLSNTTTITVTKNGGGSFTAGGVVRAIVYAWVLDTMGDA